jgi:3-oxoadipate enol-lactonase
MGSMVAQSFALTHPELIQSLCLIGSTCPFSDPVRQALRDRAASARQGGMPAVLNSATGHWFTLKFQRDRLDVIGRAEKAVLADAAEPALDNLEISTGRYYTRF